MELMNGTESRVSGCKVRDCFREGEERQLPRLRVLRWAGLTRQSEVVGSVSNCGDRGKFHNPEKFGDLGGGLFEFKSFQIRMPFAYAKNERGLILITHGFVKKKDKTPKEELTRAWRIYEEDQFLARLAIVRMAKL